MGDRACSEETGLSKSLLGGGIVDKIVKVGCNTVQTWKVGHHVNMEDKANKVMKVLGTAIIAFCVAHNCRFSHDLCIKAKPSLVLLQNILERNCFMT